MTVEPEFHRIRRLPPYVFAEVNAMKAAARGRGRDIIDLGMGNPDQPTPAHIVEKLVETVRNGRTHRSSTSRGITGLRRALARYYDRRFGVGLDPESEVCVTLGSKEGLANLAQAITAPGDTILTPNPSYPIHPYGFIIAGAAIRHVELAPGRDLIRDLASAEHSVPPPSVMISTRQSDGAAGRSRLLPEPWRGKARGMFILSDIAYARSTSTGRRRRPRVEGAFDVAVGSRASRRPIPCQAGGSASPPAIAASFRR